jgi:hypothetical protein
MSLAQGGTILKAKSQLFRSSSKVITFILVALMVVTTMMPSVALAQSSNGGGIRMHCQKIVFL